MNRPLHWGLAGWPTGVNVMEIFRQLTGGLNKSGASARKEAGPKVESSRGVNRS
jgi:hypothetical protein